MARLLLVGLVLGRAAAAWCVRPANRRTAVGRAFWMQATCRRLLRVLGVSVASGAAGMAAERSRVSPGGMIVCNHLGYLDILVLGAAVPAVFVAKREVRGWPVFGLFARMAGTLFVDRSRRGDVARVAAEMTATLATGVCVVVFPEGTSGDGSRVLPFRPALLEPAVRQHGPVTPAALDYAVPAGRSAAAEVCWWGDMDLAPHLLNLATIPRIQARLAFGEAALATGNMDRKMLASLLYGRVAALREPDLADGANGLLAGSGFPLFFSGT
ncbi:1-acyl-sn-glycerol-3-phosphate acyltransferase [Opitutaceae bacterium TAV1]|nr:1-acyl-sn-glycerol-3-phosphate acyltransferase [Opitutaceae bacterium TAV1]